MRRSANVSQRLVISTCHTVIPKHKHKMLTEWNFRFTRHLQRWIALTLSEKKLFITRYQNFQKSLFDNFRVFMTHHILYLRCLYLCFNYLSIHSRMKKKVLVSIGSSSFSADCQYFIAKKVLDPIYTYQYFFFHIGFSLYKLLEIYYFRFQTNVTKHRSVNHL